MSFSLTQLKELIPIDYSISDALLEKYLEIVTTEVDLALSNIFADPLSPVLEADCINYGTQNRFGSNFILINAWQQSGLTIKRTHKENENLATLTETPLTLGEDYTFFYGWLGKKIPGITQPITAIKLRHGLRNYEVLRIYGTYGWQAGYPGDVQQAIANIVVSLAGNAQNTANQGGITGAKREKSMTTEVEYTDAMAESLRNQARNFLNDPAYLEILGKYQLLGEDLITVI